MKVKKVQKVEKKMKMMDVVRVNQEVKLQQARS
jgi:hypothetical protein